MARPKSQDVSGVGEDSFLDTTANLVGILIILVVVIGAKTKTDAEAYGRKLAEEEQSTEALAEPKRKAVALRESLKNQQKTLVQYEQETTYREKERDLLLAKVTIAREHVDNKLEGTDAAQAALVEETQKRQQLESEISKVKEHMGAAESQERPKIILEHLPTPMARTVFTKELHVQLKQQRITLIPWDRLVGTLKQHLPLAVNRSSSRRDIEDTLGPLGGFLMHYKMNAVQGGFELDRFELEPTSSAVSESLEQSLSLGGRLRLELASRDPKETVVTVWVYPDSFDEFRKMKAQLFDEGFLCAARPLPSEIRIGASPQGTRSSAQ